MRVAHTLAYSENEFYAGCSYIGLQRERMFCGLLILWPTARKNFMRVAQCSYFGLQWERNLCGLLILWSTAGRKEFLCGMLIYTLAYSGNEFYAVCSYFGQQRERILCGLLILWPSAERKNFMRIAHNVFCFMRAGIGVDLISVSLKKCNSLKQFVRDNEQKRRNQ